MLYTRQGDGGTTKILNCDQRLSKSSAIAEALGTVDEINSLLGYCRTIISELGSEIRVIQENLFIIQAELAGAQGKSINQEKVDTLEERINQIEAKLPPIKTFFISGATSQGALLDYARTVSRRAERRVVAVKEEGSVKIGEQSLAYLNRLSSLLYALARLVNHDSGIKEESPTYQ